VSNINFTYYAENYGLLLIAMHVESALIIQWSAMVLLTVIAIKEAQRKFLLSAVLQGIFSFY
jgi:hypothetical protein